MAAAAPKIKANGLWTLLLLAAPVLVAPPVDEVRVDEVVEVPLARLMLAEEVMVALLEVMVWLAITAEAEDKTDEALADKDESRFDCEAETEAAVPPWMENWGV